MGVSIYKFLFRSSLGSKMGVSVMELSIFEDLFLVIRPTIPSLLNKDSSRGFSFTTEIHYKLGCSATWGISFLNGSLLTSCTPDSSYSSSSPNLTLPLLNACLSWVFFSSGMYISIQFLHVDQLFCFLRQEERGIANLLWGLASLIQSFLSISTMLEATSNAFERRYTLLGDRGDPSREWVFHSLFGGARYT